MMLAGLYMCANLRDFTTNESKILFALLFMTEGMPEQWALDFNEGVMGATVWNVGHIQDKTHDLF